jgi:hypothetical protein
MVSRAGRSRGSLTEEWGTGRGTCEEIEPAAEPAGRVAYTPFLRRVART